MSDREISRQFRVLRQTLAIHAMLRDDYARWTLSLELILLGSSVVFCATTFAGDDLYEFFGLKGVAARVVLGVAATAALFCSIVLIRVDWQAASARHHDASEKWSATLQLFCEARQADGSWPSERVSDLSAAYWTACRTTVAIPDKKFNKCKSRYLLKCEISELKSEYPGCPRAVLWAIARYQDTWHAVRNFNRYGHKKCHGQVHADDTEIERID